MRPIGQSYFMTALVGAGLVSKAATEWTLDVSCPSQQPVTLTIAELTASYLCSDGTRKEVQMGNGYFMVDVNVETLALELKGSSVEILNFSSSATIKPVLSPGKLDFRYFSHLKSLRIIYSDIEDLSLPLPGEALTQM
uniref:RxLR effector candidate protein n=1 Tax=Hyaloperonospora arabidopsidis (strain Emoy2) TaxID=559515 RepID=M4C308_HYAAE